MHKLVFCLGNEHFSPHAVAEAYAAIERGTKLQRAFVAQLAIDMRRGETYAWERATFTKHRLEEVLGFHLDLTEAMREADHDAGLKAKDFLLNL